MRRLLFLVLSASALTAAASPAQAGDLYYRTPGDPNTGNIYAVNENGGTPRVVLGHSEYAAGSTATMSRFNHAGSNGQALLQGKPGSGDLLSADLQLIYRAPNRQVVVKAVTNLVGQGLSPYSRPVLAQDDSFFSFRARDGVGRSTIWRLNVTVDQALAPAYAPPTSFSDTRLQLLVDDATNGAENHDHTWSPDGTRLAYLDRWTDAGGIEWLSIRVLNVVEGTADPLTHPRVIDTAYATRNWAAMLRWSPVGDAILNGSQDGGIWACYADSPGVINWVARPLTTTTKTQTINERASYPLWRPDGQRIATAYTKLTTTTKTGATVREQQPGVMSTDGWPLLKLLRTSTTNNQHTPLGWTP